MVDEKTALQSWFDLVTGHDWVWFAKYLAANDTYAKAHQGGPYLGKDLVRAAFPNLDARTTVDINPRLTLPASIDSHAYSRDVDIIFYNSRRLGQRNGRDEVRMTRWGGMDVPLVAADSTGSLVIFAYHVVEKHDADLCRIWICRTSEEEDIALDRIGPIEPGVGSLYSPTASVGQSRAKTRDGQSCSLSVRQVPDAWRLNFPSGEEIVAFAVNRLPKARGRNPDRRLLERRRCEYEVFLSVEEILTMPRIAEGFATVHLFVDFANSITNRRKSRAGKSLELHARQIFDEEGLAYSHSESTEGKRTPDFLFPSVDAYNDSSRDPARLRMLAAKTTCKDRWRQILNEAARIEQKHLLTLQEGVSVQQFQEMQQSHVTLVVPEGLMSKYPSEVRPHLVSLSQFIEDTIQIEE